MLYETAIYYYYYYYNLLEMEQTRTYNISERRTITVYYKKEDGSVSIRIQDKYNDRRYADLTASRWAVLQSEIDAIDLALTNAVDNKDGVKLRRHLGFAWWASVSSGFHCVDIRKFFVPWGEERQKPTRTGVTLALREWNSLKELMSVIHGHYPPLCQKHQHCQSIDLAENVGNIATSRSYMR